MYIGDYVGNVVLKPGDFDNNKYQCLRLYKDRGQIVVLSVRKNGYPKCYSIVNGFINLFFLNYDEAISYCNMHGYKLVSKVD